MSDVDGERVAALMTRLDAIIDWAEEQEAAENAQCAQTQQQLDPVSSVSLIPTRACSPSYPRLPQMI